MSASTYIKLSKLYRDLRWDGVFTSTTFAAIHRDLYDKMIKKGVLK